MDITDIYSTLQPKTTECTLVSCVHGTYFKTDYITGHKIVLSKLKKNYANHTLRPQCNKNKN